MRMSGSWHGPTISREHISLVIWKEKIELRCSLVIRGKLVPRPSRMAKMREVGTQNIFYYLRIFYALINTLILTQPLPVLPFHTLLTSISWRSWVFMKIYSKISD